MCVKNLPVSVKHQKDAHKTQMVPFFCLTVYVVFFYAASMRARNVSSIFLEIIV